MQHKINKKSTLSKKWSFGNPINELNLGRNISNLYCKYIQMSSHSRAQRQHKINKKSTFEKSGNLKIEFDILMSVLGVVSQKQYE